MSQDYPTAGDGSLGSPGVLPPTRVADVAAMLRVMGPLNRATAADPVEGRRQLLADLCRFIGVKMGTLAPDALGLGRAAAVGPTPVPEPAAASDRPAGPVDALAPRHVQTLALLLDGFSEKEIARRLGISPHTVHQYIKDLYKRYAVSSRAELLARHYKR